MTYPMTLRDDERTMTGTTQNLQGRPFCCLVSYLMCTLGPKEWQRWSEKLAVFMIRRKLKRARVVARNIALCFPSYSPAAQSTLTQQALATQLYAMMQWLAMSHPTKPIPQKVAIEGRAHFERLITSSHGLLLICPHSAFLEMTAATLYRQCQKHQKPMGYIYRATAKKNDLTRLLRHHHMPLAKAIRADDVRGMSRFLKSGGVLMTFPDHDLGHQKSIWVDFMGVPAATSPAFMKLVRMTQAHCLPAYLVVMAKKTILTFDAPVTSWPTPEAAAIWLNDWVAHIVAKAPEQYFWVHRRFKSQPKGTPCPYANPLAFDAHLQQQKGQGDQ